MTMLMNPATGSVATEAEWRAEFQAMTADERLALWGGSRFEDADLVEVVKRHGDWVEA